MAAKDADMTIKQALDIRRMVIAKGVNRQKIQAGGEQIAIFLDALKNGDRIKLIPPIKPPYWGCIHFVDNVPVQLDQEWQTTINETGPDTPSDYIVRQIGHLYQPTGTGIVKANFVLVNLNGDHYSGALGWAKKYELPPASPRHVFSLAKAHSNLNDELEMDSCYIVAPQEVTFRGSALVCGVWFGGRGREAGADWVSGVRDLDAWIAFLRE